MPLGKCQKDSTKALVCKGKASNLERKMLTSWMRRSQVGEYEQGLTFQRSTHEVQNQISVERYD